MLKIRRSCDRLIFYMGIPIPGKDGLYIETRPWSPELHICQVCWHSPDANFTGNAQNTEANFTGNVQNTEANFTGNARNTEANFTGNAQNTQNINHDDIENFTNYPSHIPRGQWVSILVSEWYPPVNDLDTTVMTAASFLIYHCDTFHVIMWCFLQHTDTPWWTYLTCVANSSNWLNSYDVIGHANLVAITGTTIQEHYIYIKSLQMMDVWSSND